MILRIGAWFPSVVYETRIQEKLQSGKRPASHSDLHPTTCKTGAFPSHAYSRCNIICHLWIPVFNIPISLDANMD